MSVLIKGMKMPRSCDECWFRAGAWCAAIEDWRKAYNTPPNGERLEDCPLIEIPPHGRLIDGDIAEVITADHEDGDFIDGILYAAEWIANQPTIIEAEEEKT